MSRRNVRNELRQLDSWHARDRKWLATLALEPEQLEALAHISFAQGEDDLGELRYAYLEIEPGSEVMLLKYSNRNVPGTMVWVPNGNQGLKSRLHEIMDALHVTDSDLLEHDPHAF